MYSDRLNKVEIRLKENQLNIKKVDDFHPMLKHASEQYEARISNLTKSFDVFQESIRVQVEKCSDAIRDSKGDQAVGL
jgi:hypothetical protein